MFFVLSYKNKKATLILDFDGQQSWNFWRLIEVIGGFCQEELYFGSTTDWSCSSHKLCCQLQFRRIFNLGSPGTPEVSRLLSVLCQKSRVSTFYISGLMVEVFKASRKLVTAVCSSISLWSPDMRWTSVRMLQGHVGMSCLVCCLEDFNGVFGTSTLVVQFQRKTSTKNSNSKLCSLEKLIKCRAFQK